MGARAPLRGQRDIVMVDQRGTGGSNRLQCDLFGDPPDLQRLALSIFPVEQVRECREQLEKVADLTQYTTAIAMEDLDEARQWLGYGKINLWGVSYGSVAAQVYLRRHEASVRAMVLEGVAPPDELLGLHQASAAQRAIDILFERCRTDSRCNAAYPHLHEDFAAMFERVRRGTEVQVHDRNGRPECVRPGFEAVAEGIRIRLYNPDTNALAATIHQAAGGNLGPIVQRGIDQIALLFRDAAIGMMLSVTCAEDVPYITEQMTERETAGTFLGDLHIRAWQAACAQWPLGEVPADLHALVRSNVPALLISGYREPVTPPSFAERVSKELPNSRVVTFPDGGHADAGACGRDLTSEFIERGSAEGLDTSCITARKTNFPMFGIAAGVVTLLALGILIMRLFLRRRSQV